MLKDELQIRLASLDYAASLRFQNDARLSLVIVGGGALVLLNAITRATLDIDALRASPQLRDMLDSYDINSNVAAYDYCFPFNFEDRLIPVFTGDKIDVYSASLEDIVISKLCSARDKDLQDIQAGSVLSHLDWQLLEKLATAEDEVKANILNEHAYVMFKYNYDDYVRRFRP